MGECCSSFVHILNFNAHCKLQSVTPPPPSLPTPKKVGLELVKLEDGRKLTVLVSTAARARGEYLRTHFKNMREVAAALTGEEKLAKILKFRDS